MTRTAISLPVRDGVGASAVALPPGPWPLLLDFLVYQFPAIGRDAWQARMAQGDVLDTAGVALDAQSLYRAHTKVFYFRSLPAEAPIPFDEVVLFRDDTLLVVDKPHFLPVTPAGRYLQQTLLVRLKRKLGIETLAPMHRIDRETAGLVLFTIQPATRAVYQGLFRDRAVTKHYEAIAPWLPALQFPMQVRSRLIDAEHFMKMREVDGEPNAETRIELLEVQGKLARYALHPSTGQRHQLRVQMEALGIPILHDRIYPHLLPEAASGMPPDYSKPLQLLAKSLEFTDPLSGLPRHFDSRFALHFGTGCNDPL
ncbi:pseudouridine synthase [Actimicrobium sp. CCC2.4]|uniref:pseudouridine synthase n=1 Tax=Actimicrobium sp. CCC2.4 TaxID=3048606 RepID=UPI002AC8B7E9|nr:pseudouridine synthase [Actimicrobium sp. CCC2.4]MEB0135081.1 pseudouridine synthase [Actimicrobium sp. CCC2.4]WPX31872.1 pseudouridine synthase [Actimicrobium sp. CCC2.4]